jgi:hypothetical protein
MLQPREEIERAIHEAMAVAIEAIDGDHASVLTRMSDKSALRQYVQDTLFKPGNVHGKDSFVQTATTRRECTRAWPSRKSGRACAQRLFGASHSAVDDKSLHKIPQNGRLAVKRAGT